MSLPTGPQEVSLLQDVATKPAELFSADEINVFDGAASAFNQGRDAMTAGLDAVAKSGVTPASLVDSVSALGVNLERDLRLIGQKLNIGAIFKTPTMGINIPNAPTAVTPSAPGDEWRVRLTTKSSVIQGNGHPSDLMHLLRDRGGFIFPFTPTVTFTSAANYDQLTPTHSNFQFNSYQSSQASEITVTGDFTAQDEEQGKYFLAVLHFCRTVTKMFYGQDTNAGTPPPILHLAGYGDGLLPSIPCVMSNFMVQLDPNVDYFPVNVNGSVTWVPTEVNSFSVTLLPTYSRTNISQNFSLQEFAKGNLVNKGFI